MEPEELPDRYQTVSLEALNVGSRRKLSLFLNLEGVISMETGLMNNIEGLATVIGFTYLEIRNFALERNMTEAVLDAWTCVPRLQPTVGNLWKYLEELGRTDVLTDCHQCIFNDVRMHFRRKQEEQEEYIPSQEPGISSYDEGACAPPRQVDAVLTVDDVAQGETQHYDAFVCYNIEDLRDRTFTKELTKRLEEDHGLKLCVPGRDDLAGTAKYLVDTELIKRRCKRMIAVISKAFLASVACEWQTNYALSLSPSARQRIIVPVLTERCRVPDILRFITFCDFTKEDLRCWTWSKLVATLMQRRVPPDRSEPEESGSIAGDSQSSASFDLPLPSRNSESRLSSLSTSSQSTSSEPETAYSRQSANYGVSNSQSTRSASEPSLSRNFVSNPVSLLSQNSENGLSSQAEINQRTRLASRENSVFSTSEEASQHVRTHRSASDSVLVSLNPAFRTTPVLPGVRPARVRHHTDQPRVVDTRRARNDQGSPVTVTYGMPVQSSTSSRNDAASQSSTTNMGTNTSNQVDISPEGVLYRPVIPVVPYVPDGNGNARRQRNQRDSSGRMHRQIPEQGTFASVVGESHEDVFKEALSDSVKPSDNEEFMV